jgi:hypothetical protein
MAGAHASCIRGLLYVIVFLEPWTTGRRISAGRVQPPRHGPLLEIDRARKRPPPASMARRDQQKSRKWTLGGFGLRGSRSHWTARLECSPRCLQEHAPAAGIAPRHGDSTNSAGFAFWVPRSREGRGGGSRRFQSKRESPGIPATPPRLSGAKEMVEAAGIEPASGSAPARDSTGLVGPEISPSP